ncbi:sensor histidine kinase [Thalassobacillus sp. C254]|uniref:sensor histidine kinase n=1 Tax=Thalassobacillus sp. C254 TaxID=1225341 RepID=UPI000B08C322|nr:histidine kinase [Thalassobacillus sp. C254]
MMDLKEKWTSGAVVLICRSLGLLLLFLLWLRSDGSEAGIILLVFLAVMSIARWRFNVPESAVLVDQVACFVAFIFWPPAVFLLALPLFEAFLARCLWCSIPVIIFVFVFPEAVTLSLITVFIQAGVTGAIIGGWREETKKYQREADRQRKDRYELENLKEELLAANVQGVRMAELSERNRIAQQLHDEVGHELTASVLALQAFEQLWKEGDPASEEMFAQAQQRINNSAFHLRETVHNMKPVKELGIDGLEEICRRFELCAVRLHVYGDTSTVPSHLWTVLYPCLKEGLTNIFRHAVNPTKVEVTLDISHTS